ncbi:hypothetical protein N0V85_003486 [Neurospora sp. IMI 360204]|nr:hypothetical protein N0V85_003486 [Neurospora sp. IMI 360204]
MNSDLMSLTALEGEDPYLPNIWICDVNLTDDQELVMEHLIAHLNHPRVVSLQATANAIHALMPLKTVPENYMSSDTTARPLSSSSTQLRHPAARVMREFWCVFFDVAKNIPHWHPAQERLQNLIKNLADLYEAGAEVEKKEWMRRERDGLGANPFCHLTWWEPLPYFSDSLYKFVLPYPRDERDQEVMWHWTNFSSFQARTAATGLHRIIPTATWVLRAALEDFHPVTIEQ